MLMEKYKQVVNAYGIRPRTRLMYDMQCAPMAGTFSRFTEELLEHLWPIVVELSPEGMVHSGPAMLRHTYCDRGLKRKGALILTIVKNVV